MAKIKKTKVYYEKKLGVYRPNVQIAGVRLFLGRYLLKSTAEVIQSKALAIIQKKQEEALAEITKLRCDKCCKRKAK